VSEPLHARKRTRRCFLRLLGGATVASRLGWCAADAISSRVLHRGNGAEPTSLDPALAAFTSEVTILRDMFVGLTTLDAKGNVTFGVAADHSISDDGLRHTFALRRDATWSDGMPLTAEDFVYALRRLFTPTTGAAYPHQLFVIRNAREAAAGTRSPTDIGVSSDGPGTLHLDLEHPSPLLLRLLQLQIALPVPRHVIERHRSAWTRPENIAVNGPYTLADWQPQSFVRLRANPRYWGSSTPDFVQVIYYPTANSSLEVRRFRAAELDIAINLSSEDIPWLHEHLPQALRSSPGLNVSYIVFNLSKPPFDSPLIREALSLAIDRDTIVSKVLRTGELAAYSLVPPGTTGFHVSRGVPELELPWSARLEHARHLLAQAGYTVARPLEFEMRFSSTGSYGRKGCIAAAAMWHMIGVRTRLLTTEGRVHFSQLREGSFQVAWADWGSTIDDPSAFLDLLDSNSGLANYGHFTDSQFDGLFSEALRVASVERSAALLSVAEARAMSANPVIPIFSIPNRALVSPRLQGWADNPMDVHPTRFLRLAF